MRDLYVPLRRRNILKIIVEREEKGRQELR